MEEIDQNRGRGGIPQGDTQSIPEFKSSVKAETHSTPDYGTAFREQAATQNWMSAIGSEVAGKASNALAEKLGGEMGKKPTGDLFPSLTGFDEHLAKSYATQAHATLGLQADKLITDSNLELAKVPRLTPDLIDRKQKQVSAGLKQIYSLAPNTIRPQMEYSYGQTQLRQNEQLTERMLGQQKKDRIANLTASTQNRTERVYALSMNPSDPDKNGNSKAALIEYSSLEKAYDSAIANGDSNVAEKKAALDTARQSMLSGKFIGLAKQAEINKTTPQFLNSLAGDIPGVSVNDRHAVLSNVEQYIGDQQRLRSQNENLAYAKFAVEVAEDPKAAILSLPQLESELSPIKYQEAKLHAINALKRQKAANAESDALLIGWNNHEVFDRSDDKAKDETFDRQVMAMSQKEGISASEAETRVAASAAGAVPRFVKLLNGKAKSINPDDIESVGKSIEYMQQLQKGGNLSGVTDETIAMTNQYAALARSHPAPEAAQIAYNNIFNQSSEEKKQVNDNWDTLSATIKSTTGKLNYYTNMTGISSTNLVDPQGFTEQAESLFEAYFKLTKGDAETAKTMTQQAIGSTYGKSHVNGRPETTFYPLEDVVNLPPDSAGFIQEDIIEQTNLKLAPMKEAFDKGESQFYYEIEPRSSMKGAQTPRHNIAQNPFIYGNEAIANQVNRVSTEEAEAGSGMVIHRHWKNGTRETYPLIVKADPWLTKLNNQNKPYAGSWDIVLGTKTGWKPLQRLNPMEGEIMYYLPDRNRIRAKYAKAHEAG